MKLSIKSVADQRLIQGTIFNMQFFIPIVKQIALYITIIKIHGLEAMMCNASII